KQTAKKVTSHRHLYPIAKLAQMLFQDRAAQRIGDRCALDVMVSDGNCLVSAPGRAANYLAPASRGKETRDLAPMIDHLVESQPLLPALIVFLHAPPGGV